MAERLEEVRDEQLAWPSRNDPRVRATIEGYEGGTRPPKSLTLEVRGSDGEIDRIDLPFEALGPLLYYLEPWTFLLEYPEATN